MKNRTLESEEARLRRIFAALLPLSLGLPFAACSRHSEGKRVDPVSNNMAVADAGPDPCAPTLESATFALVDGASECRAMERLGCGLPAAVHPVDGGCTFSALDCEKLCPAYGAFTCQARDASCPNGSLSAGGAVVVTCDFCPGGVGRRPEGLLRVELAPAGSVLGAYFAQAAHLEAASVRAFRDLRAALRALGAPRRLARAAAAAARDEVRHARTTARLARRFGGFPPAVQVTRPITVPSIEDVALDNAVEGCVRETYGALVASWQAGQGRDAEVATEMDGIAADETRHAALSWAVSAWATPLLSRDARGRVRGAVEGAIRALSDQVAEPHPDLKRAAGLPTASEQRRLLAGLRRELWAC